MKKISVAIDVGALVSGHAVRGIGFYTRNLVAALEKSESKDLKVETLDFSQNSDRLSKFDVVHYPYFDLFFATLPQNPPPGMVVTVHDVIPLVYPEHYPPGFKGSLRLRQQTKRLRKAAAVITDSETSKKDIVRFLDIPPEKIFPIYLAPVERPRQNLSEAKKREIKARYHLPDKFALYVGDVNYNKNIPTLIKACKIAKLPLVICGKQALDLEDGGIDIRYVAGPRDWLRFVLGKPHPELAHYRNLLREFSKSENIYRLGFVPDGDIVAIFALAAVYCQPSFYEGFGLPVLEAMSYGAPVVAAKTQALVEIAQDAALFADPESPPDLAEKLKRVVDEPDFARELVEQGRKLLTRYSWGKTAKETVEVYRKVSQG